VTQRQKVVAGVVLAIGVAVVVLLWNVERRARMLARVPGWNATEVLPDSVAPDMATVTDAESWAANRCRPMVACCGEETAGLRVGKLYASSLASSPHSLIRASFELGGGC